VNQVCRCWHLLDYSTRPDGPIQVLQVLITVSMEREVLREVGLVAQVADTDPSPGGCYR